jgi:hypothetical protein
MRSYRNRVTQYEHCHYRKRRPAERQTPTEKRMPHEDTDTLGECHVVMEAETGGLPADEKCQFCWQHQKLRKDK